MDTRERCAVDGSPDDFKCVAAATVATARRRKQKPRCRPCRSASACAAADAAADAAALPSAVAAACCACAFSSDDLRAMSRREGPAPPRARPSASGTRPPPAAPPASPPRRRRRSPRARRAVLVHPRLSRLAAPAQSRHRVRRPPRRHLLLHRRQQRLASFSPATRAALLRRARRSLPVEGLGAPRGRHQLQRLAELLVQRRLARARLRPSCCASSVSAPRTASATAAPGAAPPPPHRAPRAAPPPAAPTAPRRHAAARASDASCASTSRAPRPAPSAPAAAPSAPAAARPPARRAPRARARRNSAACAGVRLLCFLDVRLAARRIEHSRNSRTQLVERLSISATTASGGRVRRTIKPRRSVAVSGSWNWSSTNATTANPAINALRFEPLFSLALLLPHGDFFSAYPPDPPRVLGTRCSTRLSAPSRFSWRHTCSPPTRPPLLDAEVHVLRAKSGPPRARDRSLHLRRHVRANRSVSNLGEHPLPVGRAVGRRRARGVNGRTTPPPSAPSPREHGKVSGALTASSPAARATA